MNRSPIPRVLSTLKIRRVRALLIGGQACILYGAAQFSRDIDLAVAVDPGNLDRLRAALRDLKAEPVYFPELGDVVLRRGHACHFRCKARGLNDLRIDVMGAMRGVDSFGRLWKRRVVLRVPGTGAVPLMSVPDLVRAKKTQRDRDWPMVRRLVEVDVATARPTSSRVDFWLRECRTPDLLCELAGRYLGAALRLGRTRPAVSAALRGDVAKIEGRLRREEEREREADRRYWAPLRKELERWRMERLHV